MHRWMRIRRVRSSLGPPALPHHIIYLYLFIAAASTVRPQTLPQSPPPSPLQWRASTSWPWQWACSWPWRRRRHRASPRCPRPWRSLRRPRRLLVPRHPRPRRPLQLRRPMPRYPPPPRRRRRALSGRRRPRRRPPLRRPAPRPASPPPCTWPPLWRLSCFSSEVGSRRRWIRRLWYGTVRCGFDTMAPATAGRVCLLGY